MPGQRIDCDVHISNTVHGPNDVGQLERMGRGASEGMVQLEANTGQGHQPEAGAGAGAGAGARVGAGARTCFAAVVLSCIERIAKPAQLSICRMMQWEQANQEGDYEAAALLEGRCCLCCVC